MKPEYLRLEKDFKVLQARLADPSRPQSSPEYRGDARDFKRLEPAFQKVQEYRRLAAERDSLAGWREEDAEMKALAHAELDSLRARLAALEGELDDALLPRDPEDDRSVIVEIRAGTGGDEAAIFAGDLFRMYSRYAAEKGFKTELYSSHPTERAGYKEIVFGVHGATAFRHLKFERGVHRVQRVPVTEAGGRIHTSTATVAVLPEVEDVEVEVLASDLRIDTYRASGAGGQHVNRTDSAVRLTHLPTGVVVACQDERSQQKNRARAMSLLRARIYQMKQERVDAERRDLRRSQVGTGERSEKIRTYNFPQDRVTDHRINQNFHNLPGILEGGMDDIIHALWDDEKARRAADAAAGNGS
jgi:peptide chain release factor 1